MDFDFESVEGFELDEGNMVHIERHGVEEKECEEVFINQPFFVQEDEKHSFIEERFEVFGETNTGRKLFIVFTWRGDKIRIISARDQNRKERRGYEKIEKNTGT